MSYRVSFNCSHACVDGCRNVARFSERYLKSVASKATTDFEKQVNAENEKFTSFEVDVCLSALM